MFICAALPVESQSNSLIHKMMGKKPDFNTDKHVFACSLPLKGANIDIILICHDRNFDHPRINVVTVVLRKQSEKPQFFPQKQFFVEKRFDMYRGYVSAVRFALTF